MTEFTQRPPERHPKQDVSTLVFGLFSSEESSEAVAFLDGAEAAQFKSVAHAVDASIGAKYGLKVPSINVFRLV